MATYTAADMEQACMAGDIEAVRAWLDAGGNPTIPLPASWDEGRDALSVALQHGKHDVAVLLVERGADVSGRRTDGANHLMSAWNSARLTRLLLDRGLRIEDALSNGQETVLAHSARSNGSVEVIRMLVAAGADVHLGHIEPYTNRRLAQPVQIAASWNSVDAMLVLIELGADPHVLTERGSTLMHCASGSPSFYGLDERRRSIFRVLVGLGLNINAQNRHGDTPLHLNARIGLKDKTRAVLALGADPNVQNGIGRTPLHEACNYGFTKVALALLEAGADASLRDIYKRRASDYSGFPAPRVTTAA